MDKEFDGEYVDLEEIAHSRLNEQCQYISWYIDGRNGYPNLGIGLRFEGDPRRYHEIKIHRDDVGEFIRRILKQRTNLAKMESRE